MFGYYLRLALQSLRRNPGLTALMVLAIALGIAVCMMTFTIYHAMASNPIEWKSDQLYCRDDRHLGPARARTTRTTPDVPPTLLTYRDATALHTSGHPEAQRRSCSSPAPCSTRAARAPSRFDAHRCASRPVNFFPMFEVPFQYGSGWDKAGRRRRRAGHRAERRDEPARPSAARTAWAARCAVGRQGFRVVGVLKPWTPSPKFYDLNNGSFDVVEDAYLPFRWGQLHELPVYGNTNCWKSEPIEIVRATS